MISWKLLSEKWWEGVASMYYDASMNLMSLPSNV